MKEIIVNKKYCTDEYFKFLETLGYYDYVRWMTDEELGQNALYIIIEYENPQEYLVQKVCE